MAHLEPAAGRNAIVSIAFALEFNAGLDPEIVRQMATSQALHEATGTKPRLEKEIAVTVNGPTADGVQSRDVIRYVFDIPSEHPGRPPRVSLAISPTVIACAFNEYTRWDAIGSEALKLLGGALNSAPVAQLSPSGLVLQVMDQWNWPSPYQREDLERCLRKSRYLCANLFDAKSLWHSHYGFFTEAPPEQWYQRQLDVIEASVVETNSMARQLKIIFTHRRMAKPGVASPSSADQISSNFNEIKQVHNDIFSDVITDETCNSIGFRH